MAGKPPRERGDALFTRPRSKPPKGELSKPGNPSVAENDDFLELPATKSVAAHSDGKLPKTKHHSKHAPREISSKKPVSRLREVVETTKITRRDPRFENLAGTYNETQFRKNYAFLDKYRQDELEKMKTQIQQSKDPRERQRLDRERQSLESKLLAMKRKDFERQVIKEHDKKERELVKEGKKPFYLKRGDKRNLVLTKKFDEMKKSAIDRAILRRRKKTISKERKLIPRVRAEE
ncbi:uncharacterized protein V1518DRAFT_414197 [Limtongia smithiae]|uniref:uncharacterized protein n=1 Tax=Limtongia smithiae TaxID=1125753 RepID=UPI0034CDA511